MAYAGGGNDEYAIKAAELNQTFIGRAFVYNQPMGGVLYGKLAAAVVDGSVVTIYLAGVAPETQTHTVNVGANAELWFSRYEETSQVLAVLEQVEEHIRKRK